MKKQFILTTLFLCGFVSLSSAQGLFKVIASSGSNTKSGVTLKVGAQLMATDQITVGARSYLGLSYAKGGTVQISTAGSYSVKDLETKLLATRKTGSQKYADFIIGEVVKSGDANMHKNPYAYQNVTGSVERGSSSMEVLLPNTSPFLGDSYTFAWHKVVGAKKYKVEFFDSFDEVLQTINTQDTTCAIDLKSAALKSADLIKIKVSPNEGIKDFLYNKIPDFSLNRDEETKGKFLTKYKVFLKTLGDDAENDANKQLDLAVFLEENGMFLDALQAYKKATKLDTNNEIFKIAYEQFLVRNAIGENKEKEASANKEK